MLKGICHFCISEFSMTCCDCSSAASNDTHQRQCKHVPLTFFCGGHSTPLT